MRFSSAGIPGVYLIEPELVQDDRGFFARTYCEREFATNGLKCQFVQHNISYNKFRGTLRGMHFQKSPYEETKVVRCTQGAIYDVIVDLRRDSPTFAQWVGIELSEMNRVAIYIPEGCAHGFQTLEDDAEVLYQMSEFYYPESAAGVRWDDPAFGISWPLEVTKISERDRSFPIMEI